MYLFAHDEYSPGTITDSEPLVKPKDYVDDKWRFCYLAGFLWE